MFIFGLWSLKPINFKVTSLLLCLAGRLARMEGEDGEEANTKRTKLLDQLEEANNSKKEEERNSIIRSGPD